MNPNHICIEFRSRLKPGEMLDRLRQRFPEAKWRGSDTDTQGPSLSSIVKGQPLLKVFFEEEANRFCINFGSLSLSGIQLEKYRSEFVEHIKQSILPVVTS
jgi:hypothetical protein